MRALSSSNTIGSGTILEVVAGQADSGDTILAGGVEIVAAGGVASDTVIDGGTLDLQAGGDLGATVAFAGEAGTLEIDGPTMPSAAIVGFGIGPTIDLTGIAFDSAGSAVLTSGNVLQVNQNGRGVALNLDPAHDYTGHGFALSSDGHGGTDIVDPHLAPQVTSVTAPTGDYGPGSVIGFTVNFNATVLVHLSPPLLALSNGATATYASGNDTGALVFDYTVGTLGSGQDSPDLGTASTNALQFTGTGFIENSTSLVTAVLSGANNINPSGTLQIDTTAPPAPSGLALSPASDSGVQGDDITSVTTPTITGTGEVGDTVTLLDGNSAIGAATVGSDGGWSITPTAPLALGDNVLTATETDAAGNTSSASAALDLTIKTSAPAPSGLTLDPSTDSGVQGDDITDFTQPEIDGRGEIGDTVDLYDGTTLVGTGTVAGNGTWQITTSTLGLGSPSLTATETDVAGNTSAASSPLNLTIAAPPSNATVVPSTNSANSFTNNSTIDANSGNDTINTFGSNGAVNGGPGSDTINVFGQSDSVVGGTGPDTISAYGGSDTVTAGSGNDVIAVYSSNDQITAGSGFDLISVYGNNDSIAGGSGPDTITVFGQDDQITGAGGNDQITLIGNSGTITGGSGLGTITVFGNTDAVSGTTGADTVSVNGDFDTVSTGSGPESITLSGASDTVQAGAFGNTTAASITLSGTSMTFADGSHTYADTVTGFSEASGDTIKLSGAGHTVASSSQVNGGADMLITLSSGSTILLKGVGHIDNSIFS